MSSGYNTVVDETRFDFSQIDLEELSFYLLYGDILEIF